MASPSRIITFTTDFGNQDYYVSAMKAVILSINPNVRFIDISHDLPPQDIMSGAWILKNTAFLYPPGTIHLAVIDPETGGKRRPILVKIRNQYFIGPDNGLFSLVTENEEIWAMELTEKRFWHNPVASTFHGRHIFAPVAAHLCNGTPIEAFGREMDEITKYHWATPIFDNEGIQGWIIHIDRYGNLVTNINEALIREHGRDAIYKIYAGNTILNGISETFSSVPDGEAVAYIGSSGMMEIAINKGNAEKMLGIEKGAPVSLILKK